MLASKSVHLLGTAVLFAYLYTSTVEKSRIGFGVTLIDSGYIVHRRGDLTYIMDTGSSQMLHPPKHSGVCDVNKRNVSIHFGATNNKSIIPACPLVGDIGFKITTQLPGQDASVGIIGLAPRAPVDECNIAVNTVPENSDNPFVEFGDCVYIKFTNFTTGNIEVGVCPPPSVNCDTTTNTNERFVFWDSGNPNRVQLVNVKGTSSKIGFNGVILGGPDFALDRPMYSSSGATTMINYSKDGCGLLERNGKKHTMKFTKAYAPCIWHPITTVLM